MLTAFLVCWLVCALVWVCALCRAAHTPTPKNQRRHTLAKLLTVHGRRFLS
jgi:hypothetical protein